MIEERCPLCGGTGRESVDERQITARYAEVAANAVKQVEALRARVKKLEAALGFYASANHWKRVYTDDKGAWRKGVADDCGVYARAALGMGE
jgi:hypothetical protein